MAVEQTRLQRIAFSNIGLQEQTLSGKNVETHLRALGHQCQQLFAVHEVMAVFLCEVGPVVQGLGAVHKDMIQLHISEACGVAGMQFHWTGAYLCVALPSTRITCEQLSAGCTAPTSTWRYIQFARIEFKASRPLLIYHTHLASSNTKKLTDHTRKQVFETIAKHAGRCPMKHGAILGGDFNCDVAFLTDYLSRHAAWYPDPSLLFPSLDRNAKHGDLAISIGLPVKQVECEVPNVDKAHDTTLVSWPPLASYSPPSIVSWPSQASYSPPARPVASMGPLPARARARCASGASASEPSASQSARLVAFPPGLEACEEESPSLSGLPADTISSEHGGPASTAATDAKDACREPEDADRQQLGNSTASERGGLAPQLATDAQDAAWTETTHQNAAASAARAIGALMTCLAPAGHVDWQQLGEESQIPQLCEADATVLKDVSFRLYWRSPRDAGGAWTLAPMAENIRTLYGARRQVEEDDTKPLDEKGVAECHTLLYDSWLQTADLTAEQQAQRAGYKRSVFQTVLRRRYGSKHCASALLQTGVAWLPTRDAAELSYHRLLDALVAWCRRLEAAFTELVESESYAAARQRTGNTHGVSGLTPAQSQSRGELKRLRQQAKQAKSLADEADGQSGKWNEWKPPRSFSSMSPWEQDMVHRYRTGHFEAEINRISSAGGGHLARAAPFRVGLPQGP